MQENMVFFLQFGIFLFCTHFTFKCNAVIKEFGYVPGLSPRPNACFGPKHNTTIGLHTTTTQTF